MIDSGIELIVSTGAQACPPWRGSGFSGCCRSRNSVDVLRGHEDPPWLYAHRESAAKHPETNLSKTNLFV